MSSIFHYSIKHITLPLPLPNSYGFFSKAVHIYFLSVQTKSSVNQHSVHHPAYKAHFKLFLLSIHSTKTIIVLNPSKSAPRPPAHQTSVQNHPGPAMVNRNPTANTPASRNLMAGATTELVNPVIGNGGALLL